MSLPSRSEQCATIRKLNASTEISTEDGAYVVSANWYKKFKSGVGLDRRVADETIQIPTIDNSDIIRENGKLRPGLMENVNFSILTKAVWEKLFEWYQGGPVVKADVIVDEFNNPVAITKLTEIILVYKEQQISTIINKYMKVTELIDVAREEFKIEKDTEIQLLDFFNDHFNKILDNESTLGRYYLSSKQKVVVDYKNENGEWVNVPKVEEKKNTYIQSAIPRASSSGVQRVRGTPGRYGFNNLGNTCFFNSGTQCLMHSMPFVKSFVNNEWEQWINKTNKLGTGGALASAFALTAQKMWSENTEYAIRPAELKRAVGRFAPRFSGYEQHDSHELILFMLDGIHEDLNRCKDKPYVESVVGDGTNDKSIADESWKRHKLRNDSIVVDNFHGLLRSELLCPNCHKTTVVFDPYLSIPLPLARENDRKLNILFAPYEITEKWVPIQITIRVSYLANASVISEAISQKLGRKVFVAPSTISQTGKSVKWGFADNSDSYYFSSYLVAFEIPDQTKFYIPCYLMGDVRSQYSTAYYSRDTIAAPFLVECDENIDDEKMQELVKERIKPLLDMEKEVEVSEETEKLIERIKKEEKEFKGSFEKDIFSTTGGPKKSRVLPFCSTSSFKVDLDTTKINFKVALQNSPANTPLKKKSPEAEKGVTLDKCFQLFAEPDKLDEQNQWYCPHCKDFVCAEKKLNVWNAPNLLIIQIKRFSGSGYYIKKDDTYVDFPEILDMSKYCLTHPEGVSQKYRLYAVSEHMGGMGGGHYIAHARVTTSTKDGGEWYCFDDSSCSPASKEAAHSPLAYVLFYQRIDAGDNDANE